MGVPHKPEIPELYATVHKSPHFAPRLPRHGTAQTHDNPRYHSRQGTPPAYKWGRRSWLVRIDFPEQLPRSSRGSQLFSSYHWSLITIYLFKNLPHWDENDANVLDQMIKGAILLGAMIIPLTIWGSSPAHMHGINIRNKTSQTNQTQPLHWSQPHLRRTQYAYANK